MHFMEYQILVGKPEVPIPSHKLRVYYLEDHIDSNDTGDITLVNFL